MTNWTYWEAAHNVCCSQRGWALVSERHFSSFLLFCSVQEGEGSGKRKAEDDEEMATKKAKKYVISDEEEEEDDE